MRLIVLFEDTPPMAAVRARLEPAHLEYLRTHANEILIAGGTREVPGGPYVGGLWILEVQSKARAVQLVEGDPYYIAERRPYRVLVWGKALPDQPAVL